jgi:Excreted virulence factor EspC, type VII ESX diderm
MTTPEPEPTPTPPHITYPAGPPEDLSPFPMWPNATPGPDGTMQTPNYPPYVPEQQFDASQGMPRSTLDGIHGTRDSDPVRWAPSHPGELPPYWMNRYVQDQNDPNLWWPDTRPDAPGSTHPAAYHAYNGTPSVPGAGGKKPLQLDYAELEKFAKDHDLNAQELADWASGDPDFPERYLATHGKVNFGTYLKIREFMASKQIAGTAFAEQNTQTAAALRGVVATTQATDETNGARFGALGQALGQSTTRAV